MMVSSLPLRPDETSTTEQEVENAQKTVPVVLPDAAEASEDEEKNADVRYGAGFNGSGGSVVHGTSHHQQQNSATSSYVSNSAQQQQQSSEYGYSSINNNNNNAHQLGSVAAPPPQLLPVYISGAAGNTGNGGPYNSATAPVPAGQLLLLNGQNTQQLGGYSSTYDQNHLQQQQQTGTDALFVVPSYGSYSSGTNTGFFAPVSQVNGVGAGFGNTPAGYDSSPYGGAAVVGQQHQQQQQQSQQYGGISSSNNHQIGTGGGGVYNNVGGSGGLNNLGAGYYGPNFSGVSGQQQASGVIDYGHGSSSNSQYSNTASISNSGSFSSNQQSTDYYASVGGHQQQQQQQLLGWREGQTKTNSTESSAVVDTSKQ